MRCRCEHSWTRCRFTIYQTRRRTDGPATLLSGVARDHAVFCVATFKVNGVHSIGLFMRVMPTFRTCICCACLISPYCSSAVSLCGPYRQAFNLEHTLFNWRLQERTFITTRQALTAPVVSSVSLFGIFWVLKYTDISLGVAYQVGARDTTFQLV